MCETSSLPPVSVSSGDSVLILLWWLIDVHTLLLRVFRKRKASALKAHLLLMVYLERETSVVPANLQVDLKFVLQKTPVLLEELVKIAAVLQRAPHGYGWLVRCRPMGEGKAGGEGTLAGQVPSEWCVKL